MKRQSPSEGNENLELYVRTYYSLLRSTGEVEVRAFEEAHAYSHSSLHSGALAPEPDLAAFAYAAGRLPAEIVETKLLVLGQSHELFEAAGYDVRSWATVKTRGRRRPLRWSAGTGRTPAGASEFPPPVSARDGRERTPEVNGILGVFIASASDIDDLVPIVTAFQMEWNKMHLLLAPGARELTDARIPLDTERVATLLGLDESGLNRFRSAFATREAFEVGVRAIASAPKKLRMRMLASSHSQYQRAAQRWWSGIEPHYVRHVERPESAPRSRPKLPSAVRPPVYFVSSNTHAIANLVGGFAQTERDAILNWAEKDDPEGLGEAVRLARKSGDEAEILPLVHYLLRGYIHEDRTGERRRKVRAYEAASGFSSVSEPGNIDVDAQLIELSRIDPTHVDPRLRIPGLERLRESEAVLINIDYPLGMGAYHLLSRLGQGVGEIRGVYVMGKAATLNGRVGDVMLSGTVFDEHSKNTFLFKNAFQAGDIGRFLRYGSVFDNQRALTVRSAFLQNKEYMGQFYHDGYTVLEMEAGPFLSSVYELVDPNRVPTDEIVHLSNRVPFDLGIVHYASDTPYSRRQSLLSKSLSFFGVDSTYACALAIVRRIFEMEVARIDADSRLDGY